ncbi:MAG: insulinase family protein [Bacteroidales bacterium]|nr:insulinase family protein [Bacteroidales bacterium]
MPLNRTSAPEIQKITEIALPKIEQSHLTNEIPIYSINVGNQDVVKIQLVFKAGIWFQSQALEAYFTSQMLDEGSKNYSAAEIALKLDDYGAFVHKKTNRDNACIDIFTLSKHLESVLTVVADMLKNPIFEEAELNRLRDQEKHEFIVRNQKVKHIAQKQFAPLLFGKKHPYGSSATVNHYDAISTDLLKQFHQKHYNTKSCRIFISGKVNKTTLQIVDQYFGQENWGSDKVVEIFPTTVNSNPELKHYIPKEKVLQSAIRMGNRSIKRNHPDYFALSVVTTLFGGYFGSRLMSNIREDKGYTYGIYAGIYPQLHDSSFMISSEVGADVAQKAVGEIRFELKRLRTERVKEEELSLVKNYMSGTFLRALNGPFALGEVIKSLIENDLPEDYYQHYLNKIHQVSSEDVRNIANQYLHEDQMYELIVGKK